MAFFVEESKGNQSNNDRYQERLDLELIAIGKRSRLSMAEINEFRVKDLLAYAKIYAGVEEDKSQLATQKDIDSFYAN